ncbi:MAG: DEAD/DEAH box helicase, partial [Deltaproteobacteria bacterium]|nr:DEAD/DEAH box helicase [Deltaproteobacteria bacterium]
MSSATEDGQKPDETMDVHRSANSTEPEPTNPSEASATQAGREEALAKKEAKPILGQRGKYGDYRPRLVPKAKESQSVAASFGASDNASDDDASDDQAVSPAERVEAPAPADAALSSATNFDAPASSSAPVSSSPEAPASSSAGQGADSAPESAVSSADRQADAFAPAASSIEDARSSGSGKVGWSSSRRLGLEHSSFGLSRSLKRPKPAEAPEPARRESPSLPSETAKASESEGTSASFGRPEAPLQGSAGEPGREAEGVAYFGTNVPSDRCDGFTIEDEGFVVENEAGERAEAGERFETRDGAVSVESSESGVTFSDLRRSEDFEIGGDAEDYDNFFIIADEKKASDEEATLESGTKKIGIGDYSSAVVSPERLKEATPPVDEDKAAFSSNRATADQAARDESMDPAATGGLDESDESDAGEPSADDRPDFGGDQFSDPRAIRPNFLTSTRFSDFDLPSEIMRGIEAAGFDCCTPIQAQVIPVALDGVDIAGQAQTGTGKTTAFLVPALTRLITRPSVQPGLPRVLIVTPTRELADQIYKDAKILASSTGVTSTLVMGGMEYREQADSLLSGTDMVICTPGRLLDYIHQGVFNSSAVEIVIIDEADRLLDMGFIKDLNAILSHLPPFTQRQTMLFSATLDDRILELTYKYMNPPQYITAEPDPLSKIQIDQSLYHVSNAEKMSLLIGLLKKQPHRRVIIFCNTKSRVEWLTKKLHHYGFQAEGITGDLPQNKRLELMQAFKDQHLQIMVATDVASRGIHVEDVSHVYNYDLPQDPENYIHRIGRTARAGKSGKAVSFACEEHVYHLEAIENLLGEKIPVVWADESLFQGELVQQPEFRDRPRGRSGSARSSSSPHAGGRSAEKFGRGDRGDKSERPEKRAPQMRPGGIFGLSPQFPIQNGQANVRQELSWNPSQISDEINMPLGSGRNGTKGTSLHNGASAHGGPGDNRRLRQEGSGAFGKARTATGLSAPEGLSADEPKVVPALGQEQEYHGPLVFGAEVDETVVETASEHDGGRKRKHRRGKGGKGAFLHGPGEGEHEADSPAVGEFRPSASPLDGRAAAEPERVDAGLVEPLPALAAASTEAAAVLASSALGAASSSSASTPVTSPSVAAGAISGETRSADMNGPAVSEEDDDDEVDFWGFKTAAKKEAETRPEAERPTEKASAAYGAGAPSAPLSSSPKDVSLHGAGADQEAVSDPLKGLAVTPARSAGQESRPKGKESRRRKDRRGKFPRIDFVQDDGDKPVIVVTEAEEFAPAGSDSSAPRPHLEDITVVPENAKSPDEAAEVKPSRSSRRGRSRRGRAGQERSAPAEQTASTENTAPTESGSSEKVAVPVAPRPSREAELTKRQPEARKAEMERTIEKAPVPEAAVSSQTIFKDPVDDDGKIGGRSRGRKPRAREAAKAKTDAQIKVESVEASKSSARGEKAPRADVVKTEAVG